MYQVAFFPILIAGAVSALIGWVWYHPKVFGSAWMRMSNITPEMAERGKQRMPMTALAGVLASMAIAYVMNFFGIAWGVWDWVGAIELGFWCWAGFVAPTMLGSVLWVHKPFKLYIINASYWLVSFVAMALVLVF
ncbi:MAG: DUF1761 domain-containing protein [bacterium]|nr:DUF1761 domain-containing protein [bacterium]